MFPQPVQDSWDSLELSPPTLNLHMASSPNKESTMSSQQAALNRLLNSTNQLHDYKVVKNDKLRQAYNYKAKPKWKKKYKKWKDMSRHTMEW